MEVKFRIGIKIRKPVEEVFKAVCNKDELEKYFVKTASASLKAGASVDWTWHMQPEPIQVMITSLVPNEKIILTWKSVAGYDTEATMEFKKLGPKLTHFIITEKGWKTDQKGIDSAFDHCQGWTDMLMSLRVFLEQGIDIRMDRVE